MAVRFLSFPRAGMDRIISHGLKQQKSGSGVGRMVDIIFMN